MSERWRVYDDGTERRTPWVVRDAQDRHGPPVAAFATREEAEAHAARLAEGPFDWDEQEAWQDDDEDDWGDTDEVDGAQG